MFKLQFSFTRAPAVQDRNEFIKLNFIRVFVGECGLNAPQLIISNLWSIPLLICFFLVLHLSKLINTKYSNVAF